MKPTTNSIKCVDVCDIILNLDNNNNDCNNARGVITGFWCNVHYPMNASTNVTDNVLVHLFYFLTLIINSNLLDYKSINDLIMWDPTLGNNTKLLSIMQMI